MKIQLERHSLTEKISIVPNASPAYGHIGIRSGRKALKSRGLVQTGVLKDREHSRSVLRQTASVEAPQHTIPLDEHATKSEKESYAWTKQWYPLAAVQDLDPKRPHAQMLLGEKLVLWRDSEQQWKCFEDSCPHRQVPLSEGRINETDGHLMCGYHGWTFQGNGHPVNIPQVAATNKEKADKTCTNSRACATVRPTQERQGLIWVWGESSPTAQIESATTRIPVSSFRESRHGLQPVFEHYVRDLPGGFEVWTENMQDQSHVAFAHHGVAGSRGGDKEGYFVMRNMDQNPKQSKEKDAAFQFEFEWTGDGKAVRKTELFFTAPCMTSFWTKDTFVLYIYAVPISAHQTRLIINAWGDFPIKSKVLKFLKGFKFLGDVFRSKAHLTLNQVNQGDAVFMVGQHRALGRTPTKPGVPKYFLPGDNDKGTAAWLSWLERVGGGGPKYTEPELTEKSFWSGTGQLKRTEVLDNYTQHTQHCTACSRMLKWARNGQKACYGSLAALFLTTAALLGRTYAIYSPQVVLTCVAASAVVVVLRKMNALETRYTFMDWSQTDNT